MTARMAQHVARHVIITGEPGVGKTTAFEAAVRDLQRRVNKSVNVAGFVTREKRGPDGRGPRTGFVLETIPDGVVGCLASVEGAGAGGPRVGKYIVNLSSLNAVAVPQLTAAAAAASKNGGTPTLVVVDEVGKMECLSEDFVRAMVACYNQPSIVVVSTVALRGRGIIEEAKRRPDAHVVTITADNRDAAPARIVEHAMAALSAMNAHQS